ncbi:ScbA/BarX family gamma-butyrolactone biosynthesis protein [Streptomyces sp. NPDC057403]|uniref:ScbA/BarX family gamma-butyrolactone biosynthesis protein n=1 Tax=Streptomyces sp. NPDC057403 TaxID=3346119 RepID=UPI0036C59A7E
MSASTFHIDRAIALPAHAEHGKHGTTVYVNGGFLGRPRLTTTVPKEFVHRASVSEVMLTDWARIDNERYCVAAQWPRGHSFFAGVEGCHDPLIAAETIRQSGVLLAHTAFGVPLGHHFAVGDLDVHVHPQHTRIDWTPATLELIVTCSQVKRRAGALAGFRIAVEIYRDGHLAATGGGSLTSIAPKVYQRLRGHHFLTEGRPEVIALTAPEPPQTVGRTSPTDVVLSPIGEPHRWQLRVDTRHPVLFDHMVDHVPGMLLLEAARQATVAVRGQAALPLDMTSEFLRYVELDRPCLIEASALPAPGPDSSDRVLVTAHQEGTPVFRSTVTMAPTAA